jgi:hypothetical protein
MSRYLPSQSELGLPTFSETLPATPCWNCKSSYGAQYPPFGTGIKVRFSGISPFRVTSPAFSPFKVYLVDGSESFNLCAQFTCPYTMLQIVLLCLWTALLYVIAQEEPIGQFFNPPIATIEQPNFDSNPVWILGETQPIQWTTIYSKYSIAIWQQALFGGSAEEGPVIFRMLILFLKADKS